MTLLTIRDLCLSIHGAPILRDVSLDIAPGEIVALTGESGSGKSMTAFSAMGLLPRGSAVTGSIQLNGAELIGTSERALCDLRGNDVSMVFQEPMTALNPLRTIGDQVAEAVRIHGGSDPRGKAREALDRVELGGISMDTYPHQMSGGQRQRVVIAMAIALRPALLIADEPTTALDVTTQARILDLLRGLVQDQNMGLMLITHDLAVVADMADRIAVMQKGIVVEQGLTQDILLRPQHPYTRGLLDASRHVVDLPPPPDPEPLLRVDQVVRDYRLPRRSLWGPVMQHRAVDHVSFDINRGERVGLVGESGCGKSTLTRAILGLEEAQGGQITLDGEPVFRGHHPNLAVRRKMQVVFQDPYSSFNPRHRVDRILSEPFHLLETAPSAAERQHRVAEVLRDVGLSPDAAHRHIHAFSGGQRQRIAIARALIIRPQLVLFDEAVSALDVSVRAQVLDLIADLCRKHGLTYLFISHDLSVVRTVTDRVLVMQHGKIVEQGETETVFTDPQHPYTQTLVAAVPQLPDPST